MPFGRAEFPRRGRGAAGHLKFVRLPNLLGWVCVLAALVCAPLLAGGPGDRAEHVGGTLAELPRQAGLIDVTDQAVFRFQTHGAAVQVPYENINLLEYGQQVSRRYLLAVVISPVLLLSKKRQHFLTIGYTDDLGRQQALVFRVDKAHIRAVLVSLEAKTGRKVQYQDPEARKAGKG